MNHHIRQSLSVTIVPWQQILAVSCLCLGLGSIRPEAAAAQESYPHPTPANSTGQILLPATDDVPEEILRTEIIFEARSPLDGTVMSPADYAQLQAELAAPQTSPTLNSDIRYIIFLLQARRTFKPVIPFLP
ncbi:MAG: hypothetical protein AAF821_09820 [Cyanobacteria bacterium P01_D01_bin.156]